MKPGMPLSFISSTFDIETSAEPRERKLFKDLDTWQLLNLRTQDILDIADRLYRSYGITSQFLDAALNAYIVQSTGKDSVLKQFGIEDEPQVLVSNTKHYSWPKAAGTSFSPVTSQCVTDELPPS